MRREQWLTQRETTGNRKKLQSVELNNEFKYKHRIEMINRHLVLISNPGNPNDENYTKTTEEAIGRWEAFFRSPIGGNWKSEEITRFGEENSIDPEGLKRLLIPLNTVQCQYSMIVFCGHGCCTADDEDAIQLPIPTKENNNLLPVEDLLGGGLPFIRRTVILDACRSFIPYTSEQLFEEKQYSSIYKIDGIECGKYYDSLIMEAQPHVEILYSTSKHYKAYGSEDASQYADAMSNIVRIKSLYWKACAINNRYGHFCYNMCDLHKDLTSALADREIQTPEYRVHGKTDILFPFVAMHLPTERSLYNDDAVVEVLGGL